MQAGLREQMGGAQRVPSVGRHYLPEAKGQREEGNSDAGTAFPAGCLPLAKPEVTSKGTQEDAFLRGQPSGAKNT